MRGAAQAVIDGAPGIRVWRRLDQDQIGAGRIHLAQRRIQTLRVAARRVRQGGPGDNQTLSPGAMLDQRHPAAGLRQLPDDS